MDADSLSAEKPAEPVSIIRRGITVAGDLQGGEGLRIEGVFKGTITSSADVVVAAGGVAEARIQARRIVIQGQVQGDVSAEKSVAALSGIAAPVPLKFARVHFSKGARRFSNSSPRSQGAIARTTDRSVA